MSDGDDDDDDDDDDRSVASGGISGDDDESSRVDLEFVIGDATRPATPATGSVLILHVVDDSGRWGKGGLFNALGGLSPLVEAAYTAAGEMDDIHLGDTHVVQLDLTRPDGSAVYVGLMVAQTRDRDGRVTAIQLSMLDKCLTRAAKFALKTHTSVHLPRIGHSTPKFNWYGTERCIRKRLCSRGVPAFVYYFSRHQSRNAPPEFTRARSISVAMQSPPAVKAVTKAPPTSVNATSLLHDIFTGDVVYFHKLDPAVAQRLRRLVIAYDGDVTTDPSKATHAVVPGEYEASTSAELQGLKCEIVGEAWLDGKLVKRDE